MELLIFRLVQECLTNIHRHSGSKTALIRIEREEPLPNLRFSEFRCRIAREGKVVGLPERLA
jgi:signal transduction histidine kinase